VRRFSQARQWEVFWEVGFCNTIQNRPDSKGFVGGNFAQ
jgi:hypothetical protein